MDLFHGNFDFATFVAVSKEDISRGKVLRLAVVLGGEAPVAEVLMCPTGAHGGIEGPLLKLELPQLHRPPALIWAQVDRFPQNGLTFAVMQ